MHVQSKLIIRSFDFKIQLQLKIPRYQVLEIYALENAVLYIAVYELYKP